MSIPRRAKRRKPGFKVNHFLSLLVAAAVAAPSAAEAGKRGSTFYPAHVVARVRSNVERSDWGQKCREAAIRAAEPWLKMSNDDLWKLMFGPGIERSWMVWSNGHCPACEQNVPMYNWRIDPLTHPWKTRCPHCKEFFPKNDFQAFYRSGLNAEGIFDADKADRSPLFNAEHPDPDNPLHQFGVDDGSGYVDGEKRWRFIGAYLIYGQWKQAVHRGIRNLGAAYVLTGEPAYAHKAAILLDRVADVWPGFDFKTQAVVYEQRLGSNGYVSIWHDTCPEVREMALVYDMIFEEIRRDAALVTFLAAKATAHGLENPKTSFDDIQRNIEERILRDAIANKHKIYSNYPQQDITLAIMLAVLGLDENEAAFQKIVDAMLAKATAVDGLTGEKGLAGYSSYVIAGLAGFLEEFARADPAFLPDAVRRFPTLKKTYRFHIDTHCLGRYYPLSGDTGQFAAITEQYKGMPVSVGGPSVDGWSAVQPSSYMLLWRLYELTGDVAYVQTMVRMNGGRTQGLPYDLLIESGEEIRRQIEQIVAREGERPALASVNFQDWHLAILRSGAGENARALWLDYDSGGGHGHQDGMNLGLFAYGLNLMPDFGYPPVQFGGWGSPRATWYKMSAAHNTVVVDGENSQSAGGKTTLWADGKHFHAIRATGPALNRDRRFERTVALVDVAPNAFYVADVFRAAGGSDHTKFMHSHFGTVETKGLTLQPSPEFGHRTQMRAFRSDPKPSPGWHVDWQIEDRYKLLPEDRRVRLRYTDLTTDAEAGLAEAWIVAGIYDSNTEVWIPRVFTRRRQQLEGGDLKSTFVAIIDPYEETPTVASARRLPVHDADGHELPDTYVALSIALSSGGRDVLVFTDVEAKGDGQRITDVVVGSKPEIRTDAEAAVVRFSPEGRVTYAAVSRGLRLTCGDVEVAVPEIDDFVERSFSR